jgi:hypothetical protein
LATSTAELPAFAGFLLVSLHIVPEDGSEIFFRNAWQTTGRYNPEDRTVAGLDFE